MNLGSLTATGTRRRDGLRLRVKNQGAESARVSGWSLGIGNSPTSFDLGISRRIDRGFLGGRVSQFVPNSSGAVAVE